MQNILSIVKSFFEAAYFVSGIVVAIAAVKALGQIKIMKHESDLRTKRESLIIATEIVKDFGEKIVKKFESLSQDLSSKSLAHYKMACTTFKECKNEELSLQKEYLKTLDDKLLADFKDLVNEIERISLNLGNGIADADHAYESIGLEYCIIINALAPIISEKKCISSIKVFDSWSTRIAANRLKIDIEEKTRELQSIKVTKLDTLK